MTNKRRKSESGQGLVEYALILVLVAVVVIVVVSVISGGLTKRKPFPPRIYYDNIADIVVQDIGVNSTTLNVSIEPNARVAVYAFNSPEDTQGGALVSDTFTTVLRRSGYRVFERDQIERILTEQNLIVEGRTTVTDIEAARRLGALETVDYMVFGAVTLYRSEGQNIFRPVRIREEDIESYVEEYNAYRNWYLNGIHIHRLLDIRLSPSERIDRLRTDHEVYSLEELQTEIEDAEVSEFHTIASLGVSAKLVDVRTGQIVWMGQAETTDFTLVSAANRVVESLLTSLSIPVARTAPVSVVPPADGSAPRQVVLPQPSDCAIRGVAFARDLRLTTPVMSGPDVQVVQTLLRDMGFPAAGVTGNYEQQTSIIVQMFQELNDMTPTGVVDNQTWEMMCNGTGRAMP